MDITEVGAFGSIDLGRNISIRFGIYLPGIRASDGFKLLVRIIHRDDRFNPQVQPKDVELKWVDSHPIDLWTTTVDISPDRNSHYGREGIYLYRYQLWWARADGSKQLITRWFTDPFARATDVGELSAVTISSAPISRAWSDDLYKTPELDDLVVYEIQVEEFNRTFDGVIDRLDYLNSLGVNCLELMPVTSVKLDFDWGYGPLHYLSPNARFGGCDGLFRLVNACHSADIAIILDVVYQHVDPMFPYKLVYDDINRAVGTPKISSPMIRGEGLFGPECDFSKLFTQEYFKVVNRYWLDEYHIDGFRYDEVTDLYSGPTDTAYAKLAYDTYQYSLKIERFQRARNSYSRVIQCAEALWKARDVLRNTYTNCAWQDDLLFKSEQMIQKNHMDADFAHILDPSFCGYPNSKTVDNALGQPVEMPTAPFQYLETHDHSPLIVFAKQEDNKLIAPGDRSRYFKLQPYVIALYTCQGIPMLWQGQEFADNYNIPADKYYLSNGDVVQIDSSLKVSLRRDTHWEYFYDDYGVPLVRLYRRLGSLRRTCRALRSRDSYYYYLQSLQGNEIIAYHRYAPATTTEEESFAMVALNFSDSVGTINLPFPKAGAWRELVDNRAQITVKSIGDIHPIAVSSNYGAIFVWQGQPKTG